jgi:hypothetical protein
MGRTTMLALLMSVAGLVITSAASAQAGQLDTVFGGDGRVATDTSVSSLAAASSSRSSRTETRASWACQPAFAPTSSATPTTCR